MARSDGVKKFFRDNFLSGILVVTPLAASIYLLVKGSRWLYRKLVFLPIPYDQIREALYSVLPEYVADWIVNSFHVIEFALALSGIIILIALAGFITKIRLGKWLLNLSERALVHIPLVGMVYSGIKQLLQAIFSGKGNFSRVVLIEYPRKGIWSIGFVSREADGMLSRAAGRKLMSVFLPTTPNPTSGFLLMVPPEDIIELKITIEQAFKIIMSAGMVLAHEEAEDLIPPGDRVLGTVREIQQKCTEAGEEDNQARGSEE